jgi:hypothetical protein
LNTKTLKFTWLKKIALWLTVIVIVLFIVISFLLAGAANPILNSHLKEISASITKNLGRKVQIQAVDLRVFPSFVFHLEQVKMGEVEGSQWSAKRVTLSKTSPQILYQEDMLHLKSVDIRFNVWQALLSGGKELTIDSLKIDGLYINVHRDVQGRFNFQDQVPKDPKKELKVVDQSQKPSENKKSTPLTADKIRDLLHAVKLKNVGLQGLHVTLIDEQAHQGDDTKDHPAHIIELTRADLFFPTLELTRKIDLSLQSSLLGVDNTFNIDFSIGPFDQWLASPKFDAYIHMLLADTSPTSSPLDTTPLHPLDIKAPDHSDTPQHKNKKEINLTPKRSSDTTGFNQHLMPFIDQWQRRTGTHLKLKKVSPNLKDHQQKVQWQLQLAQVGTKESQSSKSTSVEPSPSAKSQIEKLSLAPADHSKNASILIPIPVSIMIKSENVSFAKIAPYLPATLGIKIDKTKLQGALAFNFKPQQGLKSSGTMEFTGLQLQKNKNHKNPRWAAPLELVVAPNAHVDFTDQSITLSDFQVSLNQMSFYLNGQVKDLDQKMPRLNQLKVQTKKLNLSTILKLLPPVAHALPPGMKVGGPISLSVKTSGSGASQSIQSHINLNKLLLHLPKAVYKDANVPLEIQLNTQLSPTKISIKEFRTQLSDLDLNVKGTVGLRTQDVALTAQAKPFNIDRLMRLLPSVHDAVPKNVKIRGKASLDLNVKKMGKTIDLTSKLVLQGARLQTPDVRLIGDGIFTVKVKGNPSQNLSASAESKLSTLDIKAGKSFEKAKGVPFDFKIAIKKQSQSIQIPYFNLNIANIKLQGKAQQNAQGRVVLNSRLPMVSLEPLLNLLPSMKDASPGLKQGKLGFNFQLQLSPKSIQDLSVDLKEFKFQSPKNKMSGSLSFQNPQKPVIRFHLNAPKFSLSELSPASKQKQSSSKKSNTKSKPFTMPKLDFIGKMKITQGEANGIIFDHFDADIRLQKQVLNMKKMQVNVFKGNIRCHPLVISMPTGKKAKFNGEIDIKNIQLASIIKQSTGASQILSSKMSGSINLKGQGKTWTQMLPYVYGGGDLKLKETTLNTFDLQSQILKSLGKKVKKLFKSKKAKKFGFKNLLAKTKIKSGKVSFQKDLKISTPDGPLLLNGYAKLNGRLAFEAKWNLDPKKVGGWIGKKLKRKKPIPITFKLKGTLDNPKVKNVSAKPLIKVILKAYGMGKVGKVIDKVGDLFGKKKKRKKKKRKKKKRKKKKRKKKKR